MDLDSMKKLKGTVDKCIMELTKKNDLTPAETKAVLDGMQLCDMLDEKIEECKMKEEYSEMGYSGHHQPYRRYDIKSYGQPMMYPERRSYGMDYSGDYGVQGWYQSNNGFYGNGSYCGDPYYGPMPINGRGYSRHSISDRAVEKLEHLMDAAGSDYERQELKRYIGMIRQAGMTD